MIPVRPARPVLRERSDRFLQFLTGSKKEPVLYHTERVFVVVLVLIFYNANNTTDQPNRKDRHNNCH